MHSTKTQSRINLGDWLQKYAVVISALATAFIAFAYWSQIGVMDGQLDAMQRTLEIMKEDQRIAQKPLLKMHLHSDPAKLSSAGYGETDEGGERWQFHYYLINMGGTAAYDIHYWHKTIIDSVIEIPDTSAFEFRWANDILFPASVIECGLDEVLRQTWIDRKKRGVETYRHFIISYRDEQRNRYAYHAVWRVKYEQGQPLNFIQVSYEPVPQLEVRAHIR